MRRLSAAFPFIALVCAASLAAGAAVTATDADAPAGAGPLTVRIEGARSDDGEIAIALFADDDGFRRREPLRRSRQPVVDGSARWTVESLAFGTYAVLAYHDANANGELDVDDRGRPLEAIGASGSSRRRGRPGFQRASFVFDATGQAVAVKLLQRRPHPGDESPAKR